MSAVRTFAPRPDFDRPAESAQRGAPAAPPDVDRASEVAEEVRVAVAGAGAPAGAESFEAYLDRKFDEAELVRLAASASRGRGSSPSSVAIGRVGIVARVRRQGRQ